MLGPENRRPFSLRRSNRIGTLNVFAKYKGVVPLRAVIFFFFFGTSIYPATWAFWGIAALCWSGAMVGSTLAAFGLVTAVIQGGLTGPAVKRLVERNTVVLVLVAGTIAFFSFGIPPGLHVVLVLIVIHALQGVVHPALTALMYREAPKDAQGELHGGIASLQSISLIIGTVLFSQVFGWFMQPNRIMSHPASPIPSAGA